MNKTNVTRRLMRMIAVLVAASVVAFCYAIKKIHAVFAQGMVIFGSIILFAAACFLIVVLITGLRAQKRNFFLYDPRKHQEITPDELTAEHIAERLMAYMAMFRHGQQLYLSELFDDDSEAPEVIKPLFCYQILNMLSTSPEDAPLGAFLSCGKELGDAFSTYLSLAEDAPMGREIQTLISRFDGSSTAELRSFLHQKKTYLYTRMLEYTKQHIREFDPK